LGAIAEGWPQRRTLWADVRPTTCQPPALAAPVLSVSESVGSSPQPLALPPVPAAVSGLLPPAAEPLAAAALPAAEPLVAAALPVIAPQSPGFVVSGRGRGAG